MKLKLNANSEVARKIAMCYVGSEEHDCNYTLIGLDNSGFVLGDNGVLYHDSDITIDTDTAKFDPYVAMREGVVTNIIEQHSIDFDRVLDAEGQYICWADQVKLSTDWALEQDGVECVD